MTQREQALQERAEIQALSPTERKKIANEWETSGGKRETAWRAYQRHVAGKLSQRTSDVVRRARVLSIDAPELWELLEAGKITLNQASVAVDNMSARHSETGEPLDVCLRMAIAAIFAPKRKAAMVRVGNAKFWANIRARIVTQVLRQMGTAVDPVVFDKTMSRLSKIVTACLDECRRELNSLPRNGAAITAGVSHEQLRAACKVLGVIPTGENRVDMTKVKQKKRLLVRQYHPDIGPGNQSQFESVIAAVKVIEKWNEGVTALKAVTPKGEE